MTSCWKKKRASSSESPPREETYEKRSCRGSFFYFFPFFLNFFFRLSRFALGKEKTTDESKNKTKAGTHPPGRVLHRDPQVAARQEGLLELDDVRVAEVGVVDELALDVLERVFFCFFFLDGVGVEVEVEFFFSFFRTSLIHRLSFCFSLSFSSLLLSPPPSSLSSAQPTHPPNPLPAREKLDRDVPARGPVPRELHEAKGAAGQVLHFDVLLVLGKRVAPNARGGHLGTRGRVWLSWEKRDVAGTREASRSETKKASVAFLRPIECVYFFFFTFRLSSSTFFFFPVPPRCRRQQTGKSAPTSLQLPLLLLLKRSRDQPQLLLLLLRSPAPRTSGAATSGRRE